MIKYLLVVVTECGCSSSSSREVTSTNWFHRSNSYPWMVMTSVSILVLCITAAVTKGQ